VRTWFEYWDEAVEGARCWEEGPHPPIRSLIPTSCHWKYPLQLSSILKPVISLRYISVNINKWAVEIGIETGRGGLQSLLHFMLRGTRDHETA
jgi:hypothetical protein